MSAATLPAHDHAGRRARLREELDPAGIALFVVTHTPNVRYLTGFTGSHGQVLVGADGTEVLITDARYDGRAEVECPDVDRVLDRDWVGHVVAFAGEHEVPQVGFEGAHLIHDTAMDLHSRLRDRGASGVSCRGHLERLRLTKDEAELARLEEACRLTDVTFAALIHWVRPGRTERQVARFVERTMEDLGADGPAFPTIVASGPNGAIPHHAPSDRLLATGELVTVDMGAMVDGYHADMTRTFAVGAPPDRLRDVYETVRAAQQTGVDAAAAGTPTTEVDAACRARLGDLAEHFLHGTGHGVGLELHEAPPVSRDSTGSLEANAVITIEPGVYLSGTGGVRIEDTVAVTSDGPARRLTTTDRHLLVL